VSPSPPPPQPRCPAPSPRCGRCSTAARPPRASAPRSLRTAAPCLQLAPGLPCPAAPRRFPLCHARRRARAAALGRTRPVHYLLHRRPPDASPPRARPLHLRLALAVGRAPQPQRLTPPAPSALLLPGAFVVVVVPYHRVASLADEPHLPRLVRLPRAFFHRSTDDGRLVIDNLCESPVSVPAS